MNKFYRTSIINIAIMFILCSVSFAKQGEWSDKDWSIKRYNNRTLYLTHGTVVYGHMFGFFKSSGDCNSDILWLTYSSSNDAVLNFIGKEVVIKIDVDDKSFDIKINMNTANKLTPMTKVMNFTNFIVGEKFINLLKNGKELKLKIIEPKELVEELDIEEDSYSLRGFVASRLKANEVCMETAQDYKIVQPGNFMVNEKSGG